MVDRSSFVILSLVAIVAIVALVITVYPYGISSVQSNIVTDTEDELQIDVSDPENDVTESSDIAGQASLSSVSRSDLYWDIVPNPSLRAGIFNIHSTASSRSRLPPSVQVAGTNVCTESMPAPRTIQKTIPLSAWYSAVGGGYNAFVEANVVSCPTPTVTKFAIIAPIGSPFNLINNNDIYTFQWPTLPGPDRAITPQITVIPGGLTSCSDTDAPSPTSHPSLRPAVPGTITYVPPGTPYVDTCLLSDRLREYACQMGINGTNSTGWGVISQDWTCAVGCDATVIPAYCLP